MQGMWEWSELEGISYQTQILRMQKLHLKRKFKKKLLSQKFAPNISKLDHSKKNHTCNSSLGWIESERRSYQILNFVGFAKIFVINLS